MVLIYLWWVFEIYLLFHKPAFFPGIMSSLFLQQNVFRTPDYKQLDVQGITNFMQISQFGDKSLNARTLHRQVLELTFEAFKKYQIFYKIWWNSTILYSYDFSLILVSKLDVKMNLSEKTKNLAADSKIRFLPLKSILEPIGLTSPTRQPES